MGRFRSNRQEMYPRSSVTFFTEEQYHISSGYSLPTICCRTLYWRFMHLFHPFIVHLLIFLCFITADASLYLPVIIGNSEFHEYKGQQYIEKKAGEILELNCSTMEAVKWILPDNSFHVGFDPVERADRVTENGFDIGFRSLRIEPLKRSDTGEYVCAAEHSGLNAKSVKEGSFLNSGPLIISKSLRGLHVILPCRMDEFIESGVELFINHIKQTKGIQFDPRIGFIVDRELLNDRTEIPARCEYLGHISEMVIVPIKNDEELEGSPLIEVSTEWPYGHVVSNRYVKIGDGIRKLLFIEDLHESDSGDYECIVTNKDDIHDIRRSMYRLQVSPTKGQLKVVDFSENTNFEEGNTVRLFHIARAFPSDEYSSEWRKYSKTLSSRGEFMEKIEKGTKSKANADLHEDELSIINAAVDDTATYQLMIRVSQDYVYQKNWTLSIRPIEIQPRITIQDEFGQPLSSDVLIDSKIIVTCVVKDMKPRKLRLLYITRGEDWEEPDDIEELSGFTFESAIKWVIYAKEHIRIRCEDDETNKAFFILQS
ncbi:unnamed protein product [Acanthocheilonema viteae]|uniref:Ig-like domain-containing protein n=1 Tax=Acanthocheilonema viteae TaxID=6277 RepID=A0A498SED7_ACAVI|nr:unnamed protein product [Acanthocheilonema viteae]